VVLRCRFIAGQMSKSERETAVFWDAKSNLELGHSEIGWIALIPVQRGDCQNLSPGLLATKITLAC